MKIFFIFLVFICFSQIAFAQKKFQITIKLDSSISAPKVRYQYDDGKTTIYATPDGGNKKNEIILKGRYFSAF